MNILVTGAAGFIGFHLSLALLKLGYSVTGFDNINDYYDVKLKQDRLNILLSFTNFNFVKADLSDKNSVFNTFEKGCFDRVVNLAAQAGVRYSFLNPDLYVNSNVVGFLNVLEACRHYKIKHLIYASSSSVYGLNKKMPFSVHDSVDHPISLYAATKKSNELMAHAYSQLFNVPTTGLRFFSVYGPWGRPDMVLFLFTKAIIEGKPIKVFNNGQMKRDFTYIDDIVNGIIKIMDCIPQARPELTEITPAESVAPYRVFNIGNGKPVELMKFIEIIEKKLNKKAEKEFLPMQDGDVVETYADIDDLMKEINFCPSIPVEIGVNNFIDWYKDYYKIE